MFKEAKVVEVDPGKVKLDLENDVWYTQDNCATSNIDGMRHSVSP